MMMYCCAAARQCACTERRFQQTCDGHTLLVMKFFDAIPRLLKFDLSGMFVPERAHRRLLQKPTKNFLRCKFLYNTYRV